MLACAAWLSTTAPATMQHGYRDSEYVVVPTRSNNHDITPSATVKPKMKRIAPGTLPRHCMPGLLHSPPCVLRQRIWCSSLQKRGVFGSPWNVSEFQVQDSQAPWPARTAGGTGGHSEPGSTQGKPALKPGSIRQLYIACARAGSALVTQHVNNAAWQNEPGAHARAWTAPVNSWCPGWLRVPRACAGPENSEQEARCRAAAGKDRA